MFDTTSSYTSFDELEPGNGVPKTNPKVLPLEEDDDVDPMDSYGLNDQTGRSFQRRDVQA